MCSSDLVIELGGGGEAASRGSSQCTQETDKHIQCGCGSTLRTRRNGLAALISEGNAYALLTIDMCDHTFIISSTNLSACSPVKAMSEATQCSVIGDVWHDG